jgi:phosphoglycerate-specific signal transduction histidine kinase
MQAIQSSTALEMLESTESLKKGDSGSFAVLRSVSRRLDLGIVDEATGVSQSAHPSGTARADIRCGCGASSAGVAEGAGLAHDAGNLLSALGLYSELLAMPGVLNEEYREYAAELRLLSERSSAMISRLFQHASEVKAEEGYRLTSLPEVVARCRGLLNRIAGQPVEVTLGYGSNRLVSVSGEAVERILINLVKNAAAAIGKNAGSVSVHIGGMEEGREARVVMTVADSGHGMTCAELNSLGRYEEPSASGHGLRFRVVRELVAMSDGSIAIASAPGEGTRVSVQWRAIEQVEVDVGESTKRVLRGEAGWIAC